MSIEELEAEVARLRAEVTLAWSRYENAIRLANGFANDRVKINEELSRWYMRLTADNKIVGTGQPRPAGAPNDWKGPPPVMASGLAADPPLPFSNKKVPIICWYRVIPDDKVKDKFNEDFSHFMDAKVTDPDPKSKVKKLIIETPTENIPPPHGGTKFSGKWVWKLKYRTDEVCPKILEEMA